jgi:prepilin-type N-terminal cleavage/methylation domain-containing protein/prepilin-type processing-associated H-X9-DG protein
MRTHANPSNPAGVKELVKRTPAITPHTALRLISKRDAFSLLELLIVVAVIAILVSLLLPALSRSRASARSIQCLNNLRQIGIATRLFLDEAASSNLPNRGGTARWPENAGSLEPYNTNTEAGRLFYCPVEKKEEAEDAVTYQFNRFGSGLSPTDQQPLGLMEMFNQPGGSMPGLRGRVEQDVINPADMIIMGEMHEVTFAISSPPPQLSPYFPFEPSKAYNPPTANLFSFRHNERANTLFADMHMEAFNRDNLIGTNAVVRRRWNRDNQPHNENWR